MSEEEKKIKIYTVYEGKLCSLLVRETEYKYILANENSRSDAFGYGSHFYKNQYETTQKKAIDRAIRELADEKEILINKISKIDKEMIEVVSLKNKFLLFQKKLKAKKKMNK